MKSWEFTDYVKGSRKTSAPIPPEVVITLSGQHPDSMRYAILELCSPRELAAMNVAGRPRPGHSIQEPKCIRCTGIDDTYDPRHVLETQRRRHLPASPAMDRRGRAVRPRRAPGRRPGQQAAPATDPSAWPGYCQTRFRPGEPHH